MPRLATALLLHALAADLAFGQDLAALAKKERERRAKVAKPVKVLTETDKTDGSVTLVSPPPAASTNSEPPRSNTPIDARAEWKARGDGLKKALVGAQELQKNAESALETYRSDLAPLTADEAQDPMRLQKREARLVELRQELEKARADVAAATAAIAAFETEARRQGIPPGWLR